MKKLFISTIALFLIMFSCQTAFAADSGHVIESWHTDAVYHQNNTIDVVETITVNYLQPRHGFFRAIPYRVIIEKETENGLEDLTYRLKLKNFKVLGGPYDKSTEGDVLVLQIGDEDETLTGLVDYQISYTIDVGDDRIDTYDEIFFSVLGADNAATVNNFTFDVAFDKPLPDALQMQVYSGEYGSTENYDSEYEVSSNHISGSITRPFDTGEAVTIYSRLPEGYFENERTASPILLYVLIAAAAVLLIFAIIKRMNQGDKAPVVTVEFTAPDGISSAEVGYILDSSPDDKDILSLIIWFASKGYLTISGEENSTTLTQKNPLPENAPAYMKTFYKALFKNRTEVELDNADSKVYEKIQKAMGELSGEFDGKRALYSSKSIVYTYLLPFMAALMAVGGQLIASDFVHAAAAICAGFSFFFILISGIIGGVTALRWSFGSMGFKAAATIGRIVPLVVSIGLSVVSSVLAVTGFTFAPTVLVVLCCAVAFFSSGLTYPTAYNKEVTGKLLGLRNFIKMAELERLEMLIHDNPQYYYDILPYAYVFNLTDVWAKQFETLSIPQPDWYSGSMHMGFYNMYWLTRSMENSRAHMLQDMAAQASKSGGAGGTSFGGGGGFSGGGVGGGGSGSW